MKVAVIGGGLAGMCAALDLSAAGHDVTIYEKYPNFGGLASAFDIAGTKLERFYHHVFSTDLDLLYLVDELGLQDKMRWSPDDNGNFYDGRIYANSPAWRILFFKPISLLGRLRLAVAAKYLSLLNRYERFDKVTAKDWIIRAMGEEVWSVFWEPLFNAKFGKHAAEISMTWLFGRVRARFGPSKKGAPTGHLGYLMGSTQVMVDALESRLKAKNVRMLASHGVKRICAENGRITGVESKDGFEAYDKVLVTCATPLLLEMASEILPAGLKADLAQFLYHGSVIAVLELKQSLSPHYWLTILDKSMPFLAVIEHSKMIGPENYQGRHIMYLAKYLDSAEPFYHLPASGVLKEYYAQLKRVFPNFDESMVLQAHVMKADYTQPIVKTGYGSRIPPHKLPVDGLYLANMTQIYPWDRGMSYSIGLGRKVAGQIIQDAA